MDKHTLDRLSQFLDILGLDEVPMGIFYTDTKPNKQVSRVRGPKGDTRVGGEN